MQSNQNNDHLVNYCSTISPKYESRNSSVLHVGCGAGYMSFILSKTFTKV